MNIAAKRCRDRRWIRWALLSGSAAGAFAVIWSVYYSPVHGVLRGTLWLAKIIGLGCLIILPKRNNYQTF